MTGGEIYITACGVIIFALIIGYCRSVDEYFAQFEKQKRRKGDE